MITGFPNIVRPKEKLQQWGSFSDIQYALRVNADRIFGINPDNIVLAMPMWEGAGNNIIDYSKYGNHGSNNKATWVGQGLGFDGSDYISNINADIGGNTQVTISIKIKSDWDFASGSLDYQSIFVQQKNN